MKLVFGSVFEKDFAELVSRFAAEASREVATHFEENTSDLVRLLLKNPELGRPRKDLKPPGIRSFRVRGFDRYRLFYQVRGGDLILLRLRHGGMNLQALFLHLA
jgi:plasmid stabilization system protein ParE